MWRSRRGHSAGRRLVAVASAATTCAVILSIAPAANADPRDADPRNADPRKADTTSEPAPPTPAPPADERVRGLIVKTATTTVSVQGLASASEAVLADASVPTDVGIGPAIAPRTRVLEFGEPVTLEQAQVAASEIQARADVVWAVPDRLMRANVAPDLPNDPRFGDQWDVWDASSPNGGYSVKAPLLWGTTPGQSSIVVAVIDTGITAHPDLDANVVAGYDFISDVDVANDGTARDPDPADPGDWITGSESAYGAFEGCDVTDSSWHGTHVAGTIAAIQDNAIGISGVAPGVRIQPLRALGKCGGYTSDIVAAMRWAAGGDVPGVPANPTPAKVINLSLGGSGDCSAPEQEVVDFARSRDVTVVVAAGNEDAPVSTSTPANCSGTVRVAATGRDGSRSYYSNYGQSPGDITIAAPGGDSTVDSKILSTYNSGTRSPASPIYASLQGSSMAAPHVAAAAALAYSLGWSTADEVRQALLTAVQPFPAEVVYACTVVLCGSGILDLSRLVAGPTVLGAPTGVSATPGDASTTVTWMAPQETGGSAISSYLATAQPGGATCTATSLTCTITGLANGTSYSITVTATNAAGLTSSSSAPVSVTPQANTALPGKVADVTVSWRKVGRTYTATIRWSAPEGFPDAQYRARLARVGGSYGSWTYLSAAFARASDLRMGRSYRVQIQAGTDDGWGTSTIVRLVP
ncbi:MAG: S8 family serine peptidase [Actinomycetales bacterium]|nr:S8 family serine peptidase [Actinomycetales bacterium]